MDRDPAPAAADPRSTPRRRANVPLALALALVAVLAGTALFVSGYSLGRRTALTPGTPTSEASDFEAFWDTYRAVTERYAGGPVDRKSVIEGAIKGMIASLDDPFSQYLTSDEFKASLRDISGEFEGIGARIGTADAAGATSSCTTLGPDCRLVVVAPIAGSPADRAGVLAGDVITAIDGKPLAGLDVDGARTRIRGPRDTAVRLTIERRGAMRDISVVRAVIVQQEVEARDLAGGRVGYIGLTGFSDRAAAELARVAREDVAAGRRELVLDLRGNPGGFVTAARAIASQFIASGTIFWEEDAAGTLTETTAEPGGAATDTGVRLVALVDGGTASAAEIVAAALQDSGRATLVGTKTYGKGTVQQWTQLEGDQGGFRLTVAKWLTPRKTWIHRTGITPDVVVGATPARPDDDPVLDRALELLGEPATGALDAAA